MKRLVISTALMAEAVPLIDFYHMQKQPKQAGFHLYRTEGMDLLVCGLGADRMQQGLRAYINRLDPDGETIWLNLGIAGALSRAIGELVWADAIADCCIGIPKGVQNHPPVTVCSLAHASVDYQPDVLFDMEAEAWLQSISDNTQQFKPEHLFCAKVVSDNPGQALHTIDKHWVTHIVRQNIKSLDKTLINILKTKS